MNDEHKTHPVDTYVGDRVRMRRKFLGMSQEQLAGHIALTFQQVQKYERGSNRISASKLFDIAKALKTPIAYFFEGYFDPAFDPTCESTAEQLVHDFLATPEGIELAGTFRRIESAKLRRHISELVRTLAEENTKQDSGALVPQHGRQSAG